MAARKKATPTPVAKEQSKPTNKIGFGRRGYFFNQLGTVYTDESSGVAAHNVEKSYAEVGKLQPHGYRKARDRANPRDAEVLDTEKDRLSKSPSYS